NLESLVDWFLSSGDFSEPETRLPFSDDDLRTIDKVPNTRANTLFPMFIRPQACAEVGIDRPSVLAAKQDPARFAQKREHRDGLVGLERLMGEVVSEMLSVVESAALEDGELRLVMTLFPCFSDLYSQVNALDKGFAKQCMHHYQGFLKGPPNRPTEDEVGFLPVILNFLRTTEESGGASDFRF
ncbi:unnamed protein product, partial [Phaeothamnion confervicola]